MAINKNNIYNFKFVLSNFIFIILIFSFGEVLKKFLTSYFEDISILNTFFVLIFIYFFQLLTEFLKIFVLFKKDNNNLRKNIFQLIFKSKFIIINFLNFTLIELIILMGLISSLFLSNFKLVITIIAVIFIGVIYSFYTLIIFKIENRGLDVKLFKDSKAEHIILVLINSLGIILLINIFYLSKYVGAVAFTVAMNLILYKLNFKYIKYRLI